MPWDLMGDAEGLLVLFALVPIAEFESSACARFGRKMSF